MLFAGPTEIQFFKILNETQTELMKSEGNSLIGHFFIGSTIKLPYLENMLFRQI